MMIKLLFYQMQRNPNLDNITTTCYSESEWATATMSLEQTF